MCECVCVCVYTYVSLIYHTRISDTAPQTVLVSLFHTRLGIRKGRARAGHVKVKPQPFRKPNRDKTATRAEHTNGV